MKLTKEQGIALTAILDLMRPDYGKTEIINFIGAHREQADFSAFAAQAVGHALAGHPLIAIIHPLAPPEPQIVYRDRPVDPAVVNEDDPTASRLLRKTDSSDSPKAIRERNPDPNHWRNRYRENIEAGKREHEALLRKMRDAPDALTDDEARTIIAARAQHRRNVELGISRDKTGNPARDALNDLADDMATRRAAPAPVRYLPEDDEFSAEAIAARTQANESDTR